MTITSNMQVSPADFDEQHYQLWYQLLERRTGVRVAALNREWLSSRISERIAELDVADSQQYYRQLVAQPDNHPEWNQLLDRVLVRDTRFFRHRESITVSVNCGDSISRETRTAALPHGALVAPVVKKCIHWHCP